MPRFPLLAASLLLAWGGTVCAEPDEALKQKIAKAIENGQAYLKAARKANGGGGGGPLVGPGGLNPGAIMPIMGGNGGGTASLTGLALVETGLDAKDPVVSALAQSARQSALSTHSTYEISLLIMFLDRVGEKVDEPFIQLLTLRLMTGQTSEGAWSYRCEGLRMDPVEERALYAELMKNAKLTTPDTTKPKKQDFKPREDIDLPPPKKDPPRKEEPREDGKTGGLHPLVAKLAQRGNQSNLPVIQMMGGGDHSNTQFATVGLWCGRRHSVNVKDALALLDKHYRNSQGGDGGWAYTSSFAASSPAMTCAGLMGLAMGFGGKDGTKKPDADVIAQDKQVEAGLKYVGNFIAAAGAQRGGRGFEANGLSNNLYFMWSLERVGMVYGLTTIGKIDWYEWGANILVDIQQADGSWRSDGFHSGSSENSTAFALLFLSRANLAQDLATSLKGKVKDPGTSKLVGGRDLDKLLGSAGKPTNEKPAGTGTTTKPKDPKDPPAVTPADEAGKLADAVVAATGAERDALIAKYRDTSGVDYTTALSRAAAKLTGDAQAAVRDALAQRLTRMKATTLVDCMRYPDRELRRGAALACAAKGKAGLPGLADELIRLLGDDEPMVVQAARASLKAMSEKDFGPEAGADAGDRGKALLAWREWWTTQK
jgi:hypothetical protein